MIFFEKRLLQVYTVFGIDTSDIPQTMAEHDVYPFARQCAGNRVYPLSIAQRYQSGEIICDDAADPKSVLFWHCCGFAYLSGEMTESFLQTVYKEYIQKERERRFVLITDDSEAIRFFSEKEDVTLDQRIEYRYNGPGAQVPDACSLAIERISAGNIARITGRIVPSFSWTSPEQFLNNGFGYVAVDGGRVAAVAFSAAVSSDEVDIGVETASEYRRRGLASVLAERMCREIVSMDKRPVWAHAISNVGSMRTAERVGFTPDRVNTVIRKRADLKNA